MARDTDQVLAELERASTQGGHPDPDALKMAIRHIRELRESMEAEPDDTRLRDAMMDEAIRKMRSDQERATARRDVHDDDSLVRHIYECKGGKSIASLISLTARFAGELQHNLIHPTLRRDWKSAPTENDQQKLVQKTATRWTDVVDPGLVGNARIACKNIANEFPHDLGSLTVEHILKGNVNNAIEIFCAVVAARWRANSVFSAGPYKTGKEQQAVLYALNEAILLFRNYKINSSDELEYNSNYKKPPRTLYELRNGVYT